MDVEIFYLSNSSIVTYQVGALVVFVRRRLDCVPSGNFTLGLVFVCINSAGDLEAREFSVPYSVPDEN